MDYVNGLGLVYMQNPCVGSMTREWCASEGAGTTINVFMRLSVKSAVQWMAAARRRLFRNHYIRGVLDRHTTPLAEATYM